MDNFQQFGLPEALNHTLAAMQFATPTPVQEKVIPLALEGRDILGSAQTGTGKTGAFGIPLVAHLLNNPNAEALILTPTRELATQVMSQLQLMLGKRSKNKTALLIGGEPYPKQFTQLRQNPRLIIGTPGRINDHLMRGTLKLNKVNFLVLDETDRMLDMGFTVQIEQILKHMPMARQTLLFSATLPRNIAAISQKYLENPVRIAIDAESAPATNIDHQMVRVKDGEKHERLIGELGARSGSVIVFVKTKFGTERMAKALSKAGHSADAIHGDLRQGKRDRVIAAFRQKKFRILVATDVAARGLDIPHIEHVINFDLPQAAEDYIHRIGRTARAGAKGSAMCMVTPSDIQKWNAINRLLDPSAAPIRGEKSGGAGDHGKRGKPQRNRKRSFGRREKRVA